MDAKSADKEKQKPTSSQENDASHTDAAVPAEKVIAAGRYHNCIQLPSPIYIAQHISPSFVLLGAGGGGSRFGMANVLVLIETSQPSGTDPKQPLWSYITAMDLGSEVPWCSSAFLPTRVALENTPIPTPFSQALFRYQQEKGLIGLFAVTGAVTLKFIGIFTCDGAPKIRLQTLARLTLPNDEANPDKKPVSLTYSCLTVAHDENGVFVYHLEDLLPPLVNEGTPSTVITAAEPFAVWSLPSRVNDLSANGISLVDLPEEGRASASASAGVSREGSPGEVVPGGNQTKVTARVMDFLLIAASVQDKTIRVASLPLKHRRRRTSSTTDITEQFSLSNAEVKCNFKFMTSSVRIIRLFATESLSKAHQQSVRRALTQRALAGSAAGAPSPLGKVLFTVFDSHSGTSNLQSFELIGGLELDTSSVEDGAKGKKKLRLSYRVAQSPSPLLKDAITSIVFSVPPPLDPSQSGPALPPSLLSGTVEGTLAWVQQNPTGAYAVVQRRPSENRREARKHPACHKEPISCVTYHHTSETVLSCDIAQNVVISYLPQKPSSNLLYRLFPPATGVLTDLLRPANRGPLLLIGALIAIGWALVFKLLL